MYAGARHSQRAYPSSPVAPPSSPMTFGPPSPTLQASDQQGLTVSTTVHFQTRPRALTGESTHSSENYPTYATYRQQQHANFDAFAQRIRRALENANAQRRRELAEHQQRQQQQQEQQEQQEKEQEEIKVRHAIDWQDADAKSSALLAVPGTLSTSAISGQPSVKGRPRSSSAASMISNISEKLRLVSSGTGTFFGRSRAGSDASVTATDTATETTAKSSLPSSITTITTTTTTTTTTAAASALEHQGKSFESSSSASTATNPTSRNRAVNDSRRGGRLSGLLSLPHPLAESSHIDDHSEDSDPSQSQFQGNHDHDQENSNAMLESDQQLEAKQSLALTAPYDGSLDVEE
ncbi:hypothetical protein BGZ83_001324 [Gryganskiella cystojenkinii]|nr:hypothetical protein BGZ83_001324 [Gryganskiella cystojenkinii]